jgi:hypothetical protein
MGSWPTTLSASRKTTLSGIRWRRYLWIDFAVTRNPYDLDRTGSSGGSGAALAANFSTVTIGEETVASIRRPACSFHNGQLLNPTGCAAAAALFKDMLTNFDPTPLLRGDS